MGGEIFVDFKSWGRGQGWGMYLGMHTHTHAHTHVHVKHAKHDIPEGGHLQFLYM